MGQEGREEGHRRNGEKEGGRADGKKARRKKGRKAERDERRDGKEWRKRGIEGKEFEGKRKIPIQDCLTAYRITPKSNNLTNSQFYKLKNKCRYYMILYKYESPLGV